MGVEFNVKCKKCSYGLSINLGIGKFYNPDSIFYGLCNSGRMLTSLVKDKPIRMTTFQLLSEGAIPLDDYGFEAYHCPQCHRLSNFFYYRLELPGKTGYYEPDYSCPVCHVLLQPVELVHDNDLYTVVNQNGENVHWKCPECGGSELIYDMESGFMALWD